MTKKALVRFDPDRPQARNSEFIAPIRSDDGRLRLVGIDSREHVDCGLVVFTGRVVSANDLLARLVDRGYRIGSLSQFMSDLETFVAQLSQKRIGAVLELHRCDEAGLALISVEPSLKTGVDKNRKLP